MKVFVLLVSVPALIEKGADAPITPDPAMPVPEIPAGNDTETSKVRFPATLGAVGLVTSILGVPPLQITGRLFTGTSA